VVTPLSQSCGAFRTARSRLDECGAEHTPRRVVLRAPARAASGLDVTSVTAVAVVRASYTLARHTLGPAGETSCDWALLSAAFVLPA
jgi:hypothetical protein